MGVYFGLAEGSKEISGIYLGSENSVKEISEGYISDADGNMKEIYTALKPGQQVFTSSGTFTVPKGVKSVDVFLVGGGGGGGYGYHNGGNGFAAGGGGGGYTTTIKALTVNPGAEYTVTIGDGCYGSTTFPHQAGKSSFGPYTASGGYSGVNEYKAGVTDRPNISNVSCGGSGGGVGGSNGDLGGKGGFDGSNGYNRINTWSSGKGIDSQTICSNSFGFYAGQSRTTRAFGESTGTLYAGGGGGGCWAYEQKYARSNGGSGGGGRGANDANWHVSGYEGTTGTGGGGGGSDCEESYGTVAGGKGGSGCVIIRWGY